MGMTQARAAVVCWCYLAPSPHATAGGAAGVQTVVRVIEEMKNNMGSCDWASPPMVDLRLGITANSSYVVVIREVVQCVLLKMMMSFICSCRNKK
jgi:hypothetical protein